eukprot:403365246
MNYQERVLGMSLVRLEEMLVGVKDRGYIQNEVLSVEFISILNDTILKIQFIDDRVLPRELIQNPFDQNESDDFRILGLSELSDNSDHQDKIDIDKLIGDEVEILNLNQYANNPTAINTQNYNQLMSFSSNNNLGGNQGYGSSQKQYSFQDINGQLRTNKDMQGIVCYKILLKKYQHQQIRQIIPL